VNYKVEFGSTNRYKSVAIILNRVHHADELVETS